MPRLEQLVSFSDSIQDSGIEYRESLVVSGFDSQTASTDRPFIRIQLLWQRRDDC